MTKSSRCSWLLTALALLCLTAARGGTTAQTDLASITVTPLTRQAGAKADWQTIYDYAGGVLPPGTRIKTEGKWIDPPVRQDQSGVTFTFPDLPDNPENSQYLRIAFGFERPLANYPTRATISYTSFFDQAPSGVGEWSPFLLTTNHDLKELFGHIGHVATHKNQPAVTDMPLKPVGDNTFTVTMNDKSGPSIIMNGQDATEFFTKRSNSLVSLKPGAMLVNGLALYNNMAQFPHNKGDWFAVHAFKIEQMRPPLEDSSEAAVDLTVPGSEPVQVTIEVVDAWNDSKGYVLRDAVVSPGKYRLYWDGIDQNNIEAETTAWVGAGSYTFRLTTSKSTVTCVGEFNSAPKYTTKSYDVINCTALAMTPPGTTAQTGQDPKWNSENNADDTRKFDATDSVQMLCTRYAGSGKGAWIAADGALINGDCGSTMMQYGRSLAMTPPDPSDPTNPAKQFYFVSEANGHSGNAVVSGSFPVEAEAKKAAEKEGEDKYQPKTLTSPDWNRTKPGFVPYQIQLGQIPSDVTHNHNYSQQLGMTQLGQTPGGATRGPQHFLFFKMGTPDDGKSQADWVIRNIRFYEEGSPDPGPMTFDPSKFSVRVEAKGKTANSSSTPLTTISETAPPAPVKTPRSKPAPPIPAGTVTVQDDGHAVHLKNAVSVNYPFDYTVTDKTIMAFDLDVIDASRAGAANGIGLSPDASATNKDDAQHYFHFLPGGGATDGKNGFNEPALGAYSYPTYEPNTLYTDSIAPAPEEAPKSFESIFLWQPGFYGLKISEDGKFLFACNNADNRLEVHDISTDGHTVAKIPINYPMFVTLAPEGAAGASPGTRYVYVDSPKEGLVRIAWNLSGNTFGKPETFVTASEFAYPRGLVYDAAMGRIFVCDAFNLDRSKQANQIVVIDPNSGKILSRFGKPGGIDPATGGQIDDETFTCPLTIDADSKGALWVNDYYSCETRKYDFDPASNGFKVERRVVGCNIGTVAHFFWSPDSPPTQAWTVAGFFVRDQADFGSDGHLTNTRITSASRQLTGNFERPYTHFSKVGDHIYATFASTENVYEKIGDGWAPRFAFGGFAGRGEETAEQAARNAGLLAKPGEPPTDLDKAIAASGDPDWATRPWAWSDLNGNGKMEYTKDNPEFKIAFGSDLSLGTHLLDACFRSSDGAFVCPNNIVKGDATILVVPPKIVNGKALYDWKNAQVIPCAKGEPIEDVLAQDGRYYVLRNSAVHNLGKTKISSVECYDEAGKLLWTREHENNSPQILQSLGDGMFSVMDRNWNFDGQVMIRTKDGDLVNQVSCRDQADCWASGALRADADTGYIGLVQVFKVTGLSTVKSAAATVNLPRAGL